MVLIPPATPQLHPGLLLTACFTRVFVLVITSQLRRPQPRHSYAQTFPGARILRGVRAPSHAIATPKPSPAHVFYMVFVPPATPQLRPNLPRRTYFTWFSCVFYVSETRKYVKIRAFITIWVLKREKPTTKAVKVNTGPDLDRHPLLDTGFLAIRAHAANPSPPKCKAEAAAEVEAETAAEVECVCVYACMCVRMCVCVYVYVCVCMYEYVYVYVYVDVYVM